VQKFRKVGAFLLAYAELVIALIVVVGISALAALNDVNDERLTQAAIALLAALAIAFMRDRADRKSLSERIDSKVAALAVSGGPWQVLDEHLIWDIDRTGDAMAVAKKTFQFMQPEVFCVYEYEYKPSGKVKSHTCWGAVEDEPMIPLPIIHRQFPGRDGRAYRLISLERVWRQGEIMNFQSFRELERYFPDARETVSKDVSGPTSKLVMCLKWPLDRKPTAIWLERTDRVPVSVDLSHVKSSGGRWVYKTEISGPNQGERVIIGWDWPAPGGSSEYKPNSSLERSSRPVLRSDC